jgi:glyoxylase-like metal-dependent hydrolase (beta-lactamase superfamily II)
MKTITSGLVLALLCAGGMTADARPRSRPPRTPAIRKPAVPSDWSAWRAEQVGDRVHALIAPDGVTGLVSGNAMIVIGDEGVLVVDTTQLPSIAAHLVATIKQLTDKPVKYVVTTHWHPDHWTGNGVLQAAWPDAILIATASTREMARTKAQPFIGTKYTHDAVAQVTKLLADGTPMSDLQRAYYVLGVEQLTGYGAELEHATIAPPTFTFDRDLTLWLGAREVDVRFLGRGNTGGDAVVYVPDAKVVASGDLLVHPYPYAIGSYIGDWIETLGKLEALGATTIVPGHGAVERDPSYLHTVVALLTSVRDQVRAAVAKKRTLAETRQDVDLSGFRTQRCGDDPWCQFGFDHVFVAPGVARAYREASEGPLHDED